MVAFIAAPSLVAEATVSPNLRKWALMSQETAPRSALLRSTKAQGITKGIQRVIDMHSLHEKPLTFAAWYQAPFSSPLSIVSMLSHDPDLTPKLLQLKGTPEPPTKATILLVSGLRELDGEQMKDDLY
jgi:hypothetical protein